MSRGREEAKVPVSGRAWRKKHRRGALRGSGRGRAGGRATEHRRGLREARGEPREHTPFAFRTAPGRWVPRVQAEAREPFPADCLSPLHPFPAPSTPWPPSRFRRRCPRASTLLPAFYHVSLPLPRVRFALAVAFLPPTHPSSASPCPRSHVKFPGEPPSQPHAPTRSLRHAFRDEKPTACPFLISRRALALRGCLPSEMARFLLRAHGERCALMLACEPGG